MVSLARQLNASKQGSAPTRAQISHRDLKFLIAFFIK